MIAYGRPSRPYPVQPGMGTDFPDLIRGPESLAESPELRIGGELHVTESILDLERVVLDDHMEARGREPRIAPGEPTRHDYYPEAWETLPAHIHLAIVPVTPGVHDVEVRSRRGARKRSVEVEAGNTRVVTFYLPW